MDITHSYQKMSAVLDPEKEVLIMYPVTGYKPFCGSFMVYIMYLWDSACAHDHDKKDLFVNSNQKYL